MGQRRSPREREEERRRVELQEFFQHLSVFVIVNVLLFIIDVMESADSFWFFWVTLFWGVGLAIHAFNALALDQRLADSVMGKQRGASADARSWESMQRPPMRSSTANAGELNEITGRAALLIDRMRTSARQIPDAEARREALSACAACDQVLAAIVDHPDEITIARDFVHRFLEPASSVIGDYSRLANRNIPSARETLRQVEAHDLPLITQRANKIYDRLHRGSLIDLEVAREMLTLNMDDSPLPDANGRERLDYGRADSASG